MSNTVVRIGGRYRLKQKIGSGSFGHRYFHHARRCGQAGAVRSTYRTSSSLEHEVMVYKDLANVLGLPRVHMFTAESGNDALVMDLFGPSLEAIIASRQAGFNLSTASVLCQQMLMLLERIHNRGYIHRDIKPSNFLLGLGQQARHVFMIDLGLASRCRNPASNIHIPYHRGQELVGSARWASANAHAGIQQSRRDDLGSLAYILVYFIRGSLPWQTLTDDDSIFAKTKSCTPATLCHDLPAEVSAFVAYVQTLAFEAEPDYAYLRSLLQAVRVRERDRIAFSREIRQNGLAPTSDDTAMDNGE
ncbi:putative casein kinase I [Auriscalpium vulgare]|uniref:Casein kinase I n=1 Tax=Auriscalpium vulgare TaxID=40419 RepID=A0ACB8RL38_9AGAM|nr:putative casein kinase I [Auriscalpium vulgare]